jgi:hypothetical protein
MYVFSTFNAGPMSTMFPWLLQVSLVLVVRLSVVADDFHSANHCSDCKETEEFSSDDADCSQLSTVDIANAAQKRLGTR